MRLADPRRQGTATLQVAVGDRCLAMPTGVASGLGIGRNLPYLPGVASSGSGLSKDGPPARPFCGRIQFRACAPSCCRLMR